MAGPARRACGEVMKPWTETEVMRVVERARMEDVYCILKDFDFEVGGIFEWWMRGDKNRTAETLNECLSEKNVRSKDRKECMLDWKTGFRECRERKRGVEGNEKNL